MNSINESLKVDASIGVNFFAPKCIDRDENFDTRNAHAIANSKCNFRCSFCDYTVKREHKPHLMTIEEFENRVNQLLKKGNMFKFTGGEPCMNPLLEEELKIVKQKGGTVFLDTNGSMNAIIKNLLEKKLIDVLGVSLKGLTKTEAIKNSGIKNEKLCWENVLDTIKVALTYSNVRVIVTYVAYDNFNYNDLLDFAKILNNLGKGVYLKINNLDGKKEEHRDKNITAVDGDKLKYIIEKFVEENEKWKNRVILINGADAITDYSKILFF